ncbi:MAG TPA: hypothetical protein ENH99_02395 [Candidatus Pacearchaeota archaeon]|nr:hypothetical protein [Candidatus Pacearchaeota archaeon]
MGLFSRVKSFFTRSSGSTSTSGSTSGSTSTDGYAGGIEAHRTPSGYVPPPITTSGGGSSGGGTSSVGTSQPSGTTSTEQALQQSLPANLRYKSVAEVSRGRTLQSQVQKKSRFQIGYERIKNYPESIRADQERKNKLYQKAAQESVNKDLGFSSPFQTSVKENERISNINSYSDQRVGYYQNLLDTGKISQSEANKKLNQDIKLFSDKTFKESFPEGTRFGGQSTPEGEVITIIPSEKVLLKADVAGKSAVKKQRTKKDFFFKDVPIELEKIGFSIVGSEGLINKALGIKNIKPTKLESAVKGYETGVLPKVTSNVILFGRGGYSLVKGSIKGTGSVAKSLKAGEGFAAFKPSPQTSEALGSIILRASPIQPKSPNLFKTVSFSSKSAVKTTGIKRGTMTQETILGKYPDIPGSSIKGRRVLIEGEEGSLSGFSVVETSVPETRFTLKGLELGRKSEISTSFQYAPSGDFAVQSISKKDFLLIGKKTPLTGKTVSSITRPILTSREFGGVVEITKSSDVIFEKTISGGVLLSRKETSLGTVEKSLGISGTQFGKSAIGIKRDISITKTLKIPESPEFISGFKPSIKQKDIIPKSNVGQIKQSQNFQATINVPKVSGSLPAPRYGASLARGETLTKQLSKVLPVSRSASAVLLSSKQFQRFFSSGRSQQVSAVSQIQIQRPSQKLFQPTANIIPLKQITRQISSPGYSYASSINIPILKAGFLLPPAFLPRLGKGGVPGAPSQKKSQPTRYQPTFSAAALGIKSFKVPEAYSKGAGGLIQRPIITPRRKKKK